MAIKNIPDKINMFNVYHKGTKLIGVSDEVTLPDLESMTETTSGAGILGEIDSPTVGQYGSMEMEIPFRILSTDMFSLISPEQVVDVTLRASEQTLASNGLDFKGVRVVVRGLFKKFTGGSVKQGSPTNSSVTVELLYYMLELDGKKVMELDKLNGVCVVNGKDVLSKARSLC